MSQLVYEERLGTERMLPLIFHMALPAINWAVSTSSTRP